jgi:hypothetical protein
VKIDILLSGLVSGLTILLGVITADWLKRLRDRTEHTRRIVMDIFQSVRVYTDYLAGHHLETFSFSSESRMSPGERTFLDTYVFLLKELRDLSESPKWPQRNARGIREAAVALRVCVIANSNHCGTYKVLLHQNNAEELFKLEYDMRVASFSGQDTQNASLLIPKKLEDLKRHMLSQEATNA